MVIFPISCKMETGGKYMKMSLIQEQTLKLNMTQELQQAITLLQFSSAELLSYVQELSIENPLIEVKETYVSSYRHQSSTNTHGFVENVTKEKTNLKDYLERQLIDFSLTKQDRHCVNLLINALDSNGYLKDEMSELATIARVEEEYLESKLYFIQSLEPAGVGARSLQECILLQLRRLTERDDLAELIIQQHFKAFAEKSWKDLSKKLNISIQRIQEVFEKVKKLEPRPGLKFQSEELTFVTPEMTVESYDGQFHIHFHDELVPQLIIHHPLSTTSESEVKDYYSKKLSQGKWIQRAIEQRKETMIKVMKVIIDKQEEFFLKGKSYLKPLTLKNIADILDIHESTVSRTVKDKFVQTPHGLFHMKSFFSNKLEIGNEDVSTSSVKIRLKEVVNKENKQKPLSDQKIANLLQSLYDITISRRTVTKYREQLNIPTSAIRKQY